MAQINTSRLLENISSDTTIYTPLVEAIVNAIQSIHESGRTDGSIEVKLLREQQGALDLDDNKLPAVVSIEISDNGAGFNQANRNSFDTLYSDQKMSIGGKGFGRFTFLKYFSQVSIDSTYKEGGRCYKRTFRFPGEQDLITDESCAESAEAESKTIVTLDRIKDDYRFRLNKKLDTIVRQLYERLLIYFINDNFTCPKITITDEDEGESATLNDYLEKHDEIQKINEDTFELTNKDITKSFEVKVFKIFYTQSSSSVLLTAHNRVVTKERLADYVPEFEDEFYDNVLNDRGETVPKNYSIKAYVLGDYLDENVSLERGDFVFAKIKELLRPFSQSEIEEKAAEIVKQAFGEEVLSRQNKKKQRVQAYVDTEAPWHKSYIADIDLTHLPYRISDVNLEAELQKHKFEIEQTTRTKVDKLLKEDKQENVANEIEKISKELTDLGKSDLAHYVVLRKVVLDLLKKSLSWNQDKKYEKEKTVHNIVFPMNKDSDSLAYDKHNLWIIDERLNFNEYLASDKALNENDERPDLLLFDRAIAVREGEDLSNPISIFEFKRPQREDYADDEDPVLQMLNYVEKIRSGNFKNIAGRNVKANNRTPAYGFLICDLTPKIKAFCKRYSLTMSPDEEGYFGYHASYDVYLQVISFDKLVKDAELRNKIFFKQLKIG